MNFILAVVMVGCLLAPVGCGPALVGSGATAGYRVATDERPVKRMFSDASITTEVKATFIADPIVKGRKIDVDTVQGTVTLTGVVETEAEADRAIQLTRNTEGVREVINNLQIGSKTMGEMLDDRWLNTKINMKLLNEAEIRSLNIDVDVHRGVVTLTGIVPSLAQKEKVIDIARTTEGTVRVIDNLTVKQ
jgi:hyperosmotically inducible protein